MKSPLSASESIFSAFSPSSKRAVLNDAVETPRKKHKSSVIPVDESHSDYDFFEDELEDEETRINPNPKDGLDRDSPILKSITNVTAPSIFSSKRYPPSEFDELDFDDNIWTDKPTSPPAALNLPDYTSYVKSTTSISKTSLKPSEESDLQQSISIYQSKVIEIQKNHIEFLTNLLRASTNLKPENHNRISSFETEVAHYESCISPLVQLTNGKSQSIIIPPKSLPKLTTPSSPPQSSASAYQAPEPLHTPKPNQPASSNSTSIHTTYPTSHTNLGSSANAPLSVPTDIEDQYDFDDGFQDISESMLEDDIEETIGIYPSIGPRQASPGIEIVSSDVEIQEIPSELEEADEFGDISSSPQGVSMTQVASKNTMTNQQFPWSSEVNRILHNTFKLKEFRCNQLDAVNATLMGKDVFVLMPTGGGKSLCYQLPALCNSGKTKGSTVVVSPLISLMQDQVFHLKKKGISAAMISGKAEIEERSGVFGDFIGGRLSLLYVSPEMLNLSNQLRNAMKNLSDRNMLARIVIDEAHCVSSWGHDFRPDYKLLENLKVDYSTVPIMALTATANERVRLDIFKCLRENNTTFLKQSFNRANLYYEVQEKSKDVNDVIANLMNTKFRGQSGIIYCHSRNSCETTAETLQNAGLKVTFYHAKLSHEEREAVQSAWQTGKIQAICATIAFGMGIDKPDVRFVFHLTLPRNMEGYYQETGRAGRDGLPSECILFYHFKDAFSMQSMINKDDLPPDIKASHKEMLKRVIQYCQNSTDCRRKQVLQYFSETFDVRKCKGNCDNCKFGQNRVKEIRDVSARAKEIVELVYSIQKDHVVLLHCIDVYRGSRLKKILDKGHDRAKNYGMGRNLDRTEVERMFHHLITEGILDEYSRYQAGFARSFIKRGPEGPKVVSGQLKVTMVFNPTTTKPITPSRPSSSTKQSKVTTSTTVTSSTHGTTSTSTIRSTLARETPTRINSYPNGNLTVTPVTTVSSHTTSHTKSIPASDFHENCYGNLELKRLQLKNDFNLSQVTDVCSNAALKDMARALPTDIESFSKISGITPLQVENFYMYFRPELVKLKSQEEHQTINSSSSVVRIETFEDEEALAEAFMDDSDDPEYQNTESPGISAVSQSPYFLPPASSRGKAVRTTSRSGSGFTARVIGSGTGSPGASSSTRGSRRGGRGGRGGFRSRGGSQARSAKRARTSVGSTRNSQARPSTGRSATQGRLETNSSTVRMMPL